MPMRLLSSAALLVLAATSLVSPTSHLFVPAEALDAARPAAPADDPFATEVPPAERASPDAEGGASIATGDVTGDCRLFAIGDLHGDLSGARRALEAARLVDSSGEWIGGCSTLVQTGDIVDRGVEGVRTLYYFKALHRQARRTGGRVVQLIGNHEIMNFAGAAEYVNPLEMARLGGKEAYLSKFSGPKKGSGADAAAAPAAAASPSSVMNGGHGAVFRWLSTRAMVASINGTIFVHAGITPSFAALGVNRLNLLARAQMIKGDFHSGVFSNDGPVWTRKIITDATVGECTDLATSLELLGAARMVIGHTVQMNKKIVSYCQGRLLAIDIGMSRQMMSAPPGLVELLPGLDVQAYYSGRAVQQPGDEVVEAVAGGAEYKLLLPPKPAA